MLAVRPGKMDVPLQCHWEVVIIISRNSHRCKQITPASGRCLGRHRVWNFSLLPWQLLFACLFIYLPTTFFEGKKLGLFLPVLSGFSAAGDFPELVSTSADSEYFVFQKKPYLTSPRFTGILQRASPGPTPDFQPKRDVRQECSLINAPSSLASRGV